MKEIIKNVRITPDAVKKHAQTKIYQAILEAIYNSIDADASEIEISAFNQQNSQLELLCESEPINGIKISDNGSGINPKNIDTYFLDFEKSWKKNFTREGKRKYHGAKGCGRFKLFAIGETLKWESIFVENGIAKKICLRLSENDPTKFVYTTETYPAVDISSGTTLFITGLKKAFFNRIVNKSEINKLLFDVLNGLILDLELDDIKINFFGEELITENYKEKDETFKFDFCDNNDKKCECEMRVLVWNSKIDFTDHKHAFFYKSDNSFLGESPSGFPADFRWPAHTLIYKSTAFDGYDWFSIEFNDLYRIIENASRSTVFRCLSSVKAKEFDKTLNLIFDNPKYPFKEAPKDALESAKVLVYNHLLGALVFNHSQELSPKKKTLTVVLSLLERIFGGDYILSENLEKVLELNLEDSKRFNSVVTRIKLSKILSKYSELIRRKTFLDTLSKLTYDEEISNYLAERTQLHKIVAEELWIFGEEFANENLIANDQSIVNIIRAYIKQKGLFFDTEKYNEELEIIISNLRADDESCINKIPDLALFKKMKDGNSEKFLIIELKKPTVKIDLKCREQALNVFKGISSAKSKGALAIDEQHKWQYCLVSSAIDNNLESEFTKGRHLEEKENGNYVIDVWKWSDIIEKANDRINVAMDQLLIEVKEKDCFDLLESYKNRFGIKIEVK